MSSRRPFVLVARPREIKVYEPVGSIDIVAECNALDYRGS
jgi:hypothetical protein